MTILETKEVTKYYGDTKAAEDISIHVLKGEIYGFLGLNGAGKTTVIRMLLGMIKPNRGDVLLFGKKLDSGFDRWNDIGYLVEIPYSYPNLTVVENLHIIYTLRGLDNPALKHDVIQRLKLEKFQNTKAGNLSLGNQQRLGLAKALMHKPSLLILDEPINGLDPEGIVEVRELLTELAAAGTAILISSHILSEISKLAHRIGIIHEGKLLKELYTTELQDRIHKNILVDTMDNRQAFEVLADHHYVVKKLSDGELEISNTNAVERPDLISKLLVEHGLPPKKVVTWTEDLEHYFLRTIQEGI